MQTKEKLDLGLPRQNYAVATIMRNFGHQSNVSLTYVDKSSLGLNAMDTLKYFNEDVRKYNIINGKNTAEFSKYSRALSLDLELLSKDNKWYSGSYATVSQNPFTSGQNFAGGVFGRFSNRQIESFLGAGVLGKNFNSENGLCSCPWSLSWLLVGLCEFQLQNVPQGGGHCCNGAAIGNPDCSYSRWNVDRYQFLRGLHDQF